MKTLDSVLDLGQAAIKLPVWCLVKLVHLVLSLTNTFHVLFSIKDQSFICRIRHCCDYVVRLESFEGSKDEHNPVYKDYHGRDAMHCVIT